MCVRWGGTGLEERGLLPSVTSLDGDGNDDDDVIVMVVVIMVMRMVTMMEMVMKIKFSLYIPPLLSLFILLHLSRLHTPA